MKKRVLLLFLFCAAACVAVWAVVRFTDAKRYLPVSSSNGSSNTPANPVDAWARAVEKVKADRGEAAAGPIEIPPELRHYSERYWFLATQVAEIDKHNVHTVQDFLDLAAMIQRGEMVPVPAVTDSYVLYGVGERADEAPFSRFEGDRSVELYNEAQLNDAYKRLQERRASIQAEISSLNSQAGKLKRSERSRRSELQKQISARQQELSSIDEDKASLAEAYGSAASRQKLFRDYESLQTLAKNFAGRSYDISNPSDRQRMKIDMLSSLRPEAFKIMEAVAAAYHRQFDRPLPVSSLVRPEQYQHALRRVNRNATRIETPPHSTGLAFDIDYRYMGAAEQTFLMSELARLKQEGRIEVIRESNANYHVFAFVNGVRPSDDLIAASLEEAGKPVQQTHHAKAAKPKQTAKKRTVKARPPRASVRKRRR